MNVYGRYCLFWLERPRCRRDRRLHRPKSRRDDRLPRPKCQRDGVAGGDSRDNSGVKGEFELRPNIGERGDVRFRARGRAAGPGIINHALYSMWLADPEGNAIFIDAARASQELTVGPLTGEVECETEVNLQDDLEQVPFNVTSVEGLTATIREGPGSNRLMAQEPLKVSDLVGQVVLQFTFTESELASLEVPTFGERQHRFSDECRSFDDRRDDDRRDRDRRDEEDHGRR